MYKRLDFIAFFAIDGALWTRTMRDVFSKAYQEHACAKIDPRERPNACTDGSGLIRIITGRGLAGSIRLSISWAAIRWRVRQDKANYLSGRLRYCLLWCRSLSPLRSPSGLSK